MAATGDSARQAVDLDNLIQEYMHFEKVSLNFQNKLTVSVKMMDVFRKARCDLFERTF